MTRYIVTVRYSACKIIDADNESEAADLALELIETADIEYDSYDADEVPPEQYADFTPNNATEEA